MKVLKVNINEKLDKKLREKAYSLYGNSKGALSKTIEDALNLFLYIPVVDQTTQLKKNNGLYYKVKDKLEETEFGKFAAISEGEFLGTFTKWEEAKSQILKRNPQTDHGLIWQIGVQRRKKAKLGWRMKVAGK